MKVTKVDLKTSDFAGTAAFGSVTFDDMVSINIKIQKGGSNGVFVSWPQYKAKDDTWKNFIFFPERDDKDAIENEIMKEFNNQIGIDKSPKADTPPEEKKEKPKRKVTF